MHQENQSELAPDIVNFCRFARESGISAGVSGTLSALEAARTVADGDRESFKFALKSALCASKEDWEAFDPIFDSFWTNTQSAAASEDAPRKRRSQSQRQESKSNVLSLPGGISSDPPEAEGKAISGASVRERLAKADFSEVPHSDQADLERIAQRLFKQMSLRLSRRLKISELHDQLDLRRTIRRSITRGGEPIDLRFRGRKPKKARLVILLDVSGSMNLYSLFLLRFAHALQNHFERTDTFIFSTSLVEISRSLRSKDLAAALQAVSENSVDWAGGTKIGDSLRDFNFRYGSKLLSRETLFIILSDGLDTGEPETLAEELQAIKRRVKKLIWLNPLLGLEQYQPTALGMAAALPSVDVFAPAHSLESLLLLERELNRCLRN
jgi:uncharacterized protein with von Willebrand factor type A (vWA) domain